jgi:hypothetical protein
MAIFFASAERLTKRENGKTPKRVFRYLFSLHFNISNKSEINEGKACFASGFFVPLHRQ